MIVAQVGEDILEVRGHAGWGPVNEDIVCAAVSILVYALAQRLEETGALEVCCMEPGYARLHARGASVAVREAMAVTATGFRLLGEAYPEQVQVQERMEAMGSEADSKGQSQEL